MTQKELGKLANISQKRMCELESGGDRIPFTTIEKLAAALNIAPYLLFVRPEDMNR
ncbi:MAG: helix-turn-helix domain-containing protein [Bacteroidales bacterium]|nr:helix-turn-helix domain-containing protein [Bacteroidales bacterium]